MPSNAAQVEELRWKKLPVLDDGFVCLVDVMGDDQAIVQAARVSYGEGTRQVSDDRGLIRYLLEKAEGAGMSEAFLEVRPSNAIAMLLYQSLGFEQISTRRGYYQAVGGREDAAVLRLRLGDLKVRTRPAR